MNQMIKLVPLKRGPKPILTTEQWESAFKRLMNNEKQTDIAKDMGISVNTLSRRYNEALKKQQEGESDEKAE